MATFVTGADEKYVRCLHLMLRSAVRHGLARGHRWVVYDLGMTDASRRSLAAIYPFVELRTFDFAAAPAHAALERRTYAWKPMIVHEVVSRSDGLVVWFDSATVFKDNPAYLLDTLRRDSVYLLCGQSSISKRCEPAILQKLGFPKRLYDTRERCAGVIGIDAGNPIARGLVEQWFQLSLDEQTIAPAHRTSVRHMHEQALLSCVFLMAWDRDEIGLASDDIDVSAGYPVRFLSTRNKPPAWTPLWADAAVRAWFAAMKFLDQRWHRVLKADNPYDVIDRWRHEHFEIRLSRDGGRSSTAVNAPAGHYYADPFLIEQDGKLWLLAEDYSYLRRRATIVALPVDENRQAGKAVAAVDPGVHASFPLMLRDGNRLFMVPETGQAGGVDLYECTRFPDVWVKRRRLLDSPGAADPCIFRHVGLWWLVASVLSPWCDDGTRHLAVYRSADLLAGQWEKHPVTDEALYLGRPHGTGRNAGAIFERDGRLYRPMQKSENFYAEGMTIMEITTLSEASYAESPANSPFPFESIAKSLCVHHMSQAGDVIAWDVRTRHR